MAAGALEFMIGFSALPLVEGVGGRLIRVKQPLAYQGVGFSITVPAGFVSDGASVPAFGWPLLRVGYVELLPAGLLHDYLYRVNAMFSDRPGPIPGRLWADGVMAEAMSLVGSVTWWDRAVVRGALAVGGWSSWHKKLVEWDGVSP